MNSCYNNASSSGDASTFNLEAIPPRRAYPPPDITPVDSISSPLLVTT